MSIAPHMLLPANPTKQYQPHGGVGGIGGGGALAYVLDNKPWFTYWDIPRLAREPYINFLRQIWISPLSQVKWKVTANSPAVAETVHKATLKFWRKSGPSLMRRYFLWGFAPGGVEYRVKDGQWSIDTVRAIEPQDARVLVSSDGGEKGEFAGFQTATTGQVLRPYAFWFKGRGELGKFYDVPPAANLFDAWTEYGTRGGAKHLRQLGMRKHSISPAVAKFKPGETTWTDPTTGQTQTIDNKTLALQVLEFYESGANVAIAAEYDENGNDLWGIDPAKPAVGLEFVSEYPRLLKEEMGEAIGIPSEVIHAAETGSGFSGRSIPYRAWLGVNDEYAGLLIDAFDDAPLRQLVRVNHGPKAEYEIEVQSLVEEYDRQNAKNESSVRGGGPEPEQPKPPPAQGGSPPRPSSMEPRPQQAEKPKPSYNMGQSAIDPTVYRDAQDKLGKRNRDARDLAQLALYDLQLQAHLEGDPAKYQAAQDEIAALAGDPGMLKAIATGQSDSYQMGWEPYTGTRGGVGFKNTDTGRVRYQASKPGEKRERAQASGKAGMELAMKARYAEGPEVHEHLKAMVDHLPAMSVDKLRDMRQVLGARFNNAKNREGMVEALKAHALEVSNRLAEAPEEKPDGADPVKAPEPEAKGIVGHAMVAGKKIEFIPHQNEGKRHTTIMVDPTKFEADYRAANPETAIHPGTHKNQKPGSIEGVKKLLESGKPVNAIRAGLAGDGTPDVSDGRHRLRILADAGADRIAMTVPKEQAAAIAKRYGVDRPRGAKAEEEPIPLTVAPAGVT